MKNQLLTLEEYKNHFFDLSVADCTVVKQGIYLFAAEDGTEAGLNSRLIKLQMGSEPIWSTSKLIGFDGMTCFGTMSDSTLGVCVDMSGQVFVEHSEGGEVEEVIPGGELEGGPCRGAVMRLKQINGWLYGCDNTRSLFKRLGRNEWLEVGPLPPYPFEDEDCGFHDFDAFSESDIYAAGGEGDVWHYDGKAWHRVVFPSNIWLKSVCCGEDGYVYIGAQCGNLFRGRNKSWELIHNGDLSLPFKDMVWFGDRIYATSDYGLWEIKDGNIHASKLSVDIFICSGNLSVGDGVMLLAGHSGAALYDGEKWTQLFSLAKLSHQARLVK
jgi:hypothetical protein